MYSSENTEPQNATNDDPPLQPPTGFSDRHEVSEAECDRDLKLSQLPMELESILTRYETVETTVYLIFNCLWAWISQTVQPVRWSRCKDSQKYNKNLVNLYTVYFFTNHNAYNYNIKTTLTKITVSVSQIARLCTVVMVTVHAVIVCTQIDNILKID